MALMSSASLCLDLSRLICFYFEEKLLEFASYRLLFRYAWQVRSQTWALEH